MSTTKVHHGPEGSVYEERGYSVQFRALRFGKARYFGSLSAAVRWLQKVHTKDKALRGLEHETE